MVDRRVFIGSALAIIACGAARGQAPAAIGDFTQFDQLLNSVSEEALEESRSYRELSYRAVSLDPRSKRGQSWTRTQSSKKPISNRARDIIIRFEVTSEARYRQAYSRPTWPGGASGVTIGVGYDLGYVAPQLMRSDWEKYIGNDRVTLLQRACRLKGNAAAGLIASLTQVDVAWPDAIKQFDDMLPFVAGETAAVFPNCDELSADSFGALVSLIYNRGSSLTSPETDRLDRRKEMRSIRDLMQRRQLAGIGDQIRQMKRLWEGDPKARGLLDRRELEARLFEAGLSQNSAK